MTKNILFPSCERCGGVFKARSTTAKYCKQCRKEVACEASAASRKRNKSKKEFVSSGKSISDVLKELEEYNRKNKTRLTYGQYVSKMKVN